MPIPPGVTGVPVHMQFVHPTTGVPASGTVTFTVPYPLRDQADKQILAPGDLPPVQLDATGQGTVTLPATDSPNVSPSGWTYTVTVRTNYYSEVFPWSVPAATVGTLELSNTAPAVTPTAVATYALVNHTHPGQTLTDATTTAKGIVQLAGDLAGTAAAPTVPALAARVQLGGDLGGTAAAPTVTSTHLASPLPVAQGGTGSTSQNFVDLSTAQTVAGVKTFSSAPVVPAGAFPESAVSNLTSDLASKALAARQITAGTGLSGGGDLTADRTLTVAYGTTAGTAAQGNDARITGAVQASVATTKGDLLAATGSATLARLGAGSNGQTVVADSTQAVGLKYTDPGWIPYDLSEYGIVTATVQPEVAQVSSAAGHWMVRIRVPAGKALTGVGVLVTSAGTLTSAGGFNSLALYDDAGANLLAQTAADDTIWTSPGWQGRAFTASYATQSSTWYARIRLQVDHMSPAPSFAYAKAGPSGSGAFTGGVSKPNHRRSVFISGAALTSWPASFDPTSIGSNTEYLPLVFLY